MGESPQALQGPLPEQEDGHKLWAGDLQVRCRSNGRIQADSVARRQIFGETITNDGAYYNDQPNSGKRTVLVTTMELRQLACRQREDLLSESRNGRHRRGDPSSDGLRLGVFQPHAEGKLAVFLQGNQERGWNLAPADVSRDEPVTGSADRGGDAAETPNVWRRDFTKAIAYVNLSDAAVEHPSAGNGWSIQEFARADGNFSADVAKLQRTDRLQSSIDKAPARQIARNSSGSDWVRLPRPICSFSE